MKRPKTVTPLSSGTITALADIVVQTSHRAAARRFGVDQGTIRRALAGEGLTPVMHRHLTRELRAA